MLMKGKKGLIVGVANKRSIAWAIAQRCAEQGAQCAFSFQSERLGENVKELTNDLPGSLLFQMDVSDDLQVQKGFDYLRESWSGIDFLVHAVAYAPRQALEGDLLVRPEKILGLLSISALIRSQYWLMLQNPSWLREEALLRLRIWEVSG